MEVFYASTKNIRGRCCMLKLASMYQGPTVVSGMSLVSFTAFNNPSFSSLPRSIPTVYVPSLNSLRSYLPLSFFQLEENSFRYLRNLGILRQQQIRYLLPPSEGLAPQAPPTASQTGKEGLTIGDLVRGSFQHSKNQYTLFDLMIQQLTS